MLTDNDAYGPRWRPLKDTAFRGRPIGLLGGDAVDEKEFKAWYAKFCAQLTTLARADEPNPLQLATLSDLTTELTRRFESIVFAGVRDMSKEREAYSTRFHGSTAACLGLLTLLRGELMRSHRRAMEE